MKRLRFWSLLAAVPALASLFLFDPPAPVAQAQFTPQGLVWPLSSTTAKAVRGEDTFRVKALNFAGVGPEDMQVKTVIKFVRRSDPRTEVTVSKILTMDNDGSAAGIVSGGVIAVPFGVAAAKGRTVTDANQNAISKTIANPGNTAANPTVIATTANHTLVTGDVVTITGTNGTPTFNGTFLITLVDATHFSIPVNMVNVAGFAATTAGTVTTTRLTSATLAATSADVGKNITCSTCGVVCTTADSPCQGPKFPIGTMYQGIITTVVSATEVITKPVITANPGGTGTVKIEPVLVADSDGLELGDGWITGVDINFWQTGPKPGQSLFEVEINRTTFNGHEGISLIPFNYLQTSGHLSWPYGRFGYSTLDSHGWTRMVNIQNPAAGADWIAAVPANAHWKNIVGCRAGLTTSATAANRLVNMIVDDGTTANNIYARPFSTAQTATQVTVYHWSPGIGNRLYTPTVGTTLFQDMDMPIGLELTEGWRMRSSTTAIQAGDQWAGITCGVNQLIAE